MVKSLPANGGDTRDVVKNPPANGGDTRDVGLIPGLGRSPGGGHGNPFQYSCLVNPMDRGAWWATVHRIAKIWTQLKCLSMHTPRPGLPCILCPWLETGSFCFQLALGTICYLMSERDRSRGAGGWQLLKLL